MFGRKSSCSLSCHSLFPIFLPSYLPFPVSHHHVFSALCGIKPMNSRPFFGDICPFFSCSHTLLLQFQSACRFEGAARCFWLSHMSSDTLGDGESRGGGLKMRLSGATSENSPRNSVGWQAAQQNPPKLNPMPILNSSPEQGSDIGMAVSFSVSPHGFAKTDPVSASQLAWSGAVTASPYSAEDLSVCHSLLVCGSSGQAGVHSFLCLCLNVSPTARNFSQLWTSVCASFSVSDPGLWFWAEPVTPSVQLLLLPPGAVCKPSDSAACTATESDTHSRFWNHLTAEQQNKQQLNVPFDLSPKSLQCNMQAAVYG